MIKLILFTFFFPLLVTAQQDTNPNRLPMVDSGRGRWLNMPPPKKWDWLHQLDLKAFRMNGYHIIPDTLFTRIFEGPHPDSLPEIDFTRQELVLSSYCVQCTVRCRDSGLGYPCHRNACRYSYSWQVRDKRSPGSPPPR